MTLRRPDPEQFPNHPDADLLDYISHYIVEIEVPGVRDVTKLKIQWLDSTTLRVKGEIEKAEQAGTSDDKAVDEHSEEHSKAREWPYVVIGERRLGTFERRFTFPTQTVEADKITAKLEAGLLTLKIPKHRLHILKGSGTVEIESGD
jgi:HSP20 family molecular chaperone IbpA